MFSFEVFIQNFQAYFTESSSLLMSFCIGSKKKGTDIEARTNSAGLMCFSSSSDQ
ncbi:hypothetical protein D3C86_1764590 [compost metagenome]